MLASLRTKFLISLCLGAAVLAALSLYADVGNLLAVLGRFEWRFLPAILGLTLLNYILRFLKWHYYLGQIGVRGLPWQDSMALFFAGLSMAMTPGKVGEWLKSYLLREMTGTPFFRSAPVVVAERLTDGLAMVLLAAGGLWLFQFGWPVVAVVLVLNLGVMVVCSVPTLAEAAFRVAGRLPWISGKVGHLREFYQGARTIFTPRNIAIGAGLGFVSWSGECIAYYLVLTGLGQAESFRLLVEAAFMLAVSSLAGSLLLTPGGLGVAEGGLTGLAQLLLGMPRELAVAAALLIRVSTLWFGVTVGLLMLLVVARRLPGKTKEMAR